MATRTSIFASVPFSAFPHPHRDTNDGKQSDINNVDALFDDLDSGSDSGYADETGIEKDGEASGEADQERHPSELHRNSIPAHAGRALVDAPSLLPTINAISSDGSSPEWTRWTSSKVTCLDTACGTTEARIDCIWLVAGCEDGSVWIFCSLLHTSSTTSTSAPASIARRSSSSLNLLSTPISENAQRRPAVSRKSSDTLARVKADASAPSPKGVVSKAASSSTTRSSSLQYRKSRTGHSNSISLAMGGGASGPSSSSPVHGRKASATVSIIDTEALARGDRAISKELPSPPKTPSSRFSPRRSPSLHADEHPPSMFEEVPKPTALNYGGMCFKPTSHVLLNDVGHSPIASVHLLPQQGLTTPLVCLTRSGKVYKVACQDGMLIGSEDLSKQTWPHLSNTGFGGSVLSQGQKSPWLFALCREGGYVIPVDTDSMNVSERESIRLPR